MYYEARARDTLLLKLNIKRDVKIETAVSPRRSGFISANYEKK